ncbi:MAG: cell wall hydrolase [Rickettsiales bacterium]|nr:cell wall hydrolase [Rickettsiales bacterium]
MELTVYENESEFDITAAKIARILNALGATRTLAECEAVASALNNLCEQYDRDWEEIIPMFAPVGFAYADSDSPEIKMATRVAKASLKKLLPDRVNGAVRFHRQNENPSWAYNIGYIAEVGDFLFYKG